MADNSCNDPGCGCNITTLRSDKDCPACGHKLRVTGNLQLLKLNMSCPACGYYGPPLSMEEIRTVID